MPPDTTNHPEPPKDASMTPSNDSSTEQTTSQPRAISISTPLSDGLYQIVNDASGDGLTFIPVSATGTNELSTKLTTAIAYEIASDIESFTSTELIPYLLKQSPGDLKVLSQKYALEVRSGSDETWRGPNCSFRYTIRLYSKFHTSGRDRRLLSISLEKLLKILSLTPTPS